ncbi:MAG: 50S ribosomal protein L25 [Candidatus Magasanikbacteria bacterium]|jgi:large subunit ribosomal protein L25|nr:50S ribosomal protein L25 [Candidatus Magasanikbacteria bacterium]
MSFAIAATKRTESASDVRAAGKIPGIVYGPHMESMSLSIPASDLLKVYKEVTDSTLVDLNIAGQESMKVLIQDAQFEPVKGAMIHVDFRQVTMGEEMTATLSLIFSGVAPAEKQLGGTLMKSMESIDVRCLPSDLVDNITVDLSTLATFDDSIRVKDLPLPKGMVCTDDAELMIVKVAPPLTEDQLKAREESKVGSVEDIEVAVKKKEPKDGEDAAA